MVGTSNSRDGQQDVILQPMPHIQHIQQIDEICTTEEIQIYICTSCGQNTEEKETMIRLTNNNVDNNK